MFSNKIAVRLITCPDCHHHSGEDEDWVCGACGQISRAYQTRRKIHGTPLTECEHCGEKPRHFVCWGCEASIILGSGTTSEPAKLARPSKPSLEAERSARAHKREMQKGKQYIEKEMMKAYIADAEDACAHYGSREKIKRQVEFDQYVNTRIELKVRRARLLHALHTPLTPEEPQSELGKLRDDLAETFETLPGIFDVKSEGMKNFEGKIATGQIQISDEDKKRIKQNIEDIVNAKLRQLTSFEPGEFDDL